MEEVLDYSRYFPSKRQMMVFEKMFHGRPVITLKAMHSLFFAAPGFEFQKVLLPTLTNFPWNETSLL